MEQPFQNLGIVRLEPLSAFKESKGFGELLPFRITAAEAVQSLEREPGDRVGLPRRGRNAAIEEIEVAVPVQLGPGQIAGIFMCQGQVLMDAWIAVGRTESC